MTSLYLSAFFENTGLTVVLVGLVFYLIERFGASLLVLGALSGIGAFVFSLGAHASKSLSRRYTPKQLTLFGTTVFTLVSLSYPLLPNLAAVFCVHPIGSFAMAVFWPSLENWISHGSGAGALKRNLSFFNLSWSPGQIVAPFLAGFLFEKNILFPIWTGALLMVPVLFLLKRFPDAPKATPTSASPLRTPVSSGQERPFEAPPRKIPPSRFLMVCWLANFTGWFGAAIFRSLFPKYGLFLELSPSVIGAFLLLIGVGQVLFFYLLGHFFEGWDRSPKFLFFWEGVSVLALLTIAWAYQPLLWIAAFFLFGCFAGTAYSASLLVSLRERGPHGGGSGSHEALIGLGICFGPLVGGAAGEFFGVNAPYFAAALVLAAVLLIQLYLLRDVFRSGPRSGPEVSPAQ